MFQSRKLAIILVFIAVFVSLFLSNATADKARSDDERTLMNFVDLEVRKVHFCNGWSAGVGVQPWIHNNGPHTAYGTKVCVKPGKRGWGECRTIGTINAGKSKRVLFYTEGGYKLTIRVVASSKNRENNNKKGNNECVVRLPKPVYPEDTRSFECQDVICRGLRPHSSSRN